ncbi:MAG TPA: 23S rRNA (uracil(1939)-C(5))-methyltransferase, partial [Gammaproteobacteria bacterium]|nr:23S rRNA (uracil(1939)-C(5))-methyltransferase [Gammaproteobacteria bacterium]
MNKNVKLDKQKKETANIHALSHDGRGIASVHKKTVFIAGALPKETVTYITTKQHRQYNEATLDQIITPAIERTTPPCRHFGVCGGCTLQHMHMDAQLVFKQQTLLEQLRHFGQVTPEHLLPPLSANTLGYRRKARLGVKYVLKKQKLLVGFREKSSRYLADLEQCVVLHPQVGEQLPALSQCIASLEAYQHIPQIEVAIGDTDVALVFRHLQPLSDEDKKKLISFGKTFFFQIYLQPNLPEPITKL